MLLDACSKPSLAANFSVQILREILGFRILLEPESKKFDPQAPQNCSEIEANGSTKAEFLPRSSKSHNFLEIQWFFDLQMGPPNQ